MPVYLAWFVLHFLLLLTVCCRETVRLVRGGLTILPRFVSSESGNAEARASATSHGHFRLSSIEQVPVAYMHLAGIESGYHFFAPNVPDGYKLFFELHYPDGRIEYELPRVSGKAAGLRLDSLLDHMGDIPDNTFREVAMKMLAYSAWHDHPRATKVRALFSVIKWPSADEYAQGQRQSYEFLSAYDFSFEEGPQQSAKP